LRTAQGACTFGLAFVSANLGALEILGMAANGAQYGMMTVHYYWIGAVPAMVFLGIVMMPFYYGSKVRSVPEFLRMRFNRPTRPAEAPTAPKADGAPDVPAADGAVESRRDAGDHE
jgi:Na+/proline symporter